MIHTLTLSPTLDLTFPVKEILFDDVTRASTAYRAPGGKGVNVSRVSTRLGHPTVALGFIGGHTGLEITELLEREGVPVWFVTVSGPSRTNPIVQDEEGRVVRVSAPGPAVQPVEVAALIRNLNALQAPDFLLASGSCPAGVPADFYPNIIRDAAGRGVNTVVDADGDQLLAGIQAGAAMIKPNRYELSRLVGRPLATLEEVLSAAREVLAMGVRTVAVSLGPQGAMLVTRESAVHAIPPQVKVESAVGAGDSFLAGLCFRLAAKDSPADALRFAVACGTATAMVAGTALCTLEGVSAVIGAVEVRALG